MRTLRATYRLIVGTVFTTGMYWTMKAGCFWHRNHPEQRFACRNRFFQAWSRVFAGLIGMELKVKGTPPAAPCVMVSNHLSYVDIIALGTRVNARFIAKSDVADWPVLGPAVRGTGTIFVDRTRARDAIRVNHLIRDMMEEGDGVIFFPEGTSSGGEDVLPLKTPLLHYCAHAGVPVHVATVSYATPPGEPPASQAVCWWGDMPFFSHMFHLFGIPRFEAQVEFGMHPVRGRDRKELAVKLWSALRQQYLPLTE